FTRNVVIAYDGDPAGRAATLRAAQVLLSAGLNVSALDLHGEKDPDSLVQKRGVDGFLEVLAAATDIFEFGLHEWASDVSQLNGRQKSERVEQFMPLLSAVTDPVMRNEAAQRIADAFRLEFETVWSRVRGKASAGGERERQVRVPIGSGEKFVLTAAVQGKLTREQVARLKEDYFEDAACRTVFSVIKSDLAAGQPIDFGELQTHVKGEVELTLLSELSLTEDIDDRTLERLDENLRPMERGYLDRRKQQIQRAIVDAERSGDFARVEQLVTEKMELSRILSALK
ncbi:MAG TPA: toprim domain-containing protein, partial [Thermoanaerobaculia bacterium]